MSVELRGPNEFEAVCECGEELKLNDERKTVCPVCHREYRVEVEVEELFMEPVR